ncbi:MAG: hypothetical protein EDQ89_11475 [Acidobacteria bacterium]|nr:MAG: hypothetical protein EDQ89_11475 [Acidobacteriota bacterium]MCL4287623.1 hypothetical protein [Thermoleophilia bacterium]
MHTISFLLAALLGFALAALGEEPPVVIALAAVILFPLAVALATGGGEGRPATGPALLGVVAGAFLVAFLVRLAIAAPGWVDPLSADCGGPSTGTQQLVTWFATLSFVLAAIPIAVAVAAIGARLAGSRALAGLPLTLSPYPFAVALAGIALIVASWATSC